MDLPLLDDVDQQSEYDIENLSEQVAMEPPAIIHLRPRSELFGTAVEPATLAQEGWKLNPTPIVWLSVNATVPYPEHRRQTPFHFRELYPLTKIILLSRSQRHR